MDAINSSADENKVQTESHKENIIEIEIPYPLFRYLSSENCNLQNICRICLSVNDQVLYPLFSYDENWDLANMFMAISEVQMSTEDGLPSKICSRCHTEVMNYYEFKMKCVKSNYTLKSVLKGEFFTKEELSTCNDNVEIKKEPENINNGIEEIENDLKPVIERETEYTDIDYLEDLKNSISDDDALCIVQDTKDKEKQITIIDNDSNNKFLKEVMLKETISSSKKIKHYCAHCPKKFHKVKSLRAHISKRHSAQVTESPYPCNQCKEAFNSEFDLKLHGMLHDQGSGWKCTECMKDFNGKQALRRHIQRHMQSKRFPCGACGKSFVERYALRRHARVHTGQRPEKKHACQICDKRFVDSSSLAAHGVRHGGARGCVCACGATFPTARLLASHRRVHDQRKPHACLHCGKRFRHESTRNTHHRTHTGERPYVCAQCGKAFIQKSNMTLHMRTHTGEKPYSCAECGRKFSSGSTLKAHLRTHTGERPYSCKVCGKRFARLNLKQHMLQHTGERPHACRACHKRFSSAARLRDHARLHTGERPFECASCTQKFTTKSQLIRHVKKHEKKKKTSKKGIVMLMPVSSADKNLHSSTNVQPENKPNEFMYVNINTAPNLVTSVPSIDGTNLCTVHETPMPTQGLLYQDDGNTKTEVLVLSNDQNLVTNGGSYVSDVNYTNDVNLVTVNEGEVSISAASATMEGTTVKLYQYDQSLLQIHTGGGQLTISRISSKMTANF